MLETSLPALLRFDLLKECLTDAAEADVTLVAVESDPESRELLGVLVYVVDDADVRLGAKPERILCEERFFEVFSGAEELA
jgi:fructose-specific component phosphotransferase system IIB-like protein